jgi:hypothetical protein
MAVPVMKWIGENALMENPDKVVKFLLKNASKIR